jgi:isopenicillin-N epimerase
VLRHVPVPLPSDEEIVQEVTEGFTSRTSLLMIDHVTSPTAAIFPVARLVATARERQVPVLVDSAHAPGMVPIDLAVLEPDFWTGNFHKWVCAPKGAAGLVVAPAHRDAVRPLVTSHGYEGSFVQEFDWTGTFDPTPWLSVPAALDFMEALGWERVRRHNHELAGFGQDVLAKALGTEPPVREGAFGAMSLVELPEGTAHGQDEVVGLQARLFEATRIEVPFVWWDERPFVRLSAQVYNAPAEYERLAAALPELL